MLFGSESFIKKVLKDAHMFAEENGVKLIYGAMVGSISKGLQNYDSDYDTRFLYINNDFPERIICPNDVKEIEIVKRYYPEDELPYEWIPCWEATSFFQFLNNPSIDGKISAGLYNVVGWTMLSPYTWDPYGLQAKIVPLINKNVKEKYLLDYNLELINKYYNYLDDIVLKDYLYSIYSAAAIKWIVQMHTFPPIYYMTLFKIFDDDKLKEETIQLLNELYQGGSLEERVRHSSHFNVCTKHREALDTFIEDMISLAKDELNATIDCSDNVIQNTDLIYQIINASIREYKIKGV